MVVLCGCDEIPVAAQVFDVSECVAKDELPGVFVFECVGDVAIGVVKDTANVVEHAEPHEEMILMVFGGFVCNVLLFCE